MGPSGLEFQGATKTEGPKSSDTQGPRAVTQALSELRVTLKA